MKNFISYYDIIHVLLHARPFTCAYVVCLIVYVLFFSYLSFLYFCFPKEDQNQNFSIKIVDVFLHIGSFHKFVKLILLFESTAQQSLFIYNMGISK